MNIAEVVEALSIAETSALNLASDIKSGKLMSRDAPDNLKSLAARLSRARAFMVRQDMTCTECGWTGPVVHFNTDGICGGCQNCS